MRELASAVEEWEVKVKNLKIEHDVDLEEGIKVALLTSFLPSDLQDFVFQWSDGKLKFGDMKDRILSLEINRASLGRPMPMEVDRVQTLQWGEEEYEQYGNGWVDEEESKMEVDYVCEACRRCGGSGHYARECSTPKGKGKDGGKAKARANLTRVRITKGRAGASQKAKGKVLVGSVGLTGREATGRMNARM